MELKALFNSYGTSLTEWAKSNGFSPQYVRTTAREWFFGVNRKPGCPRGIKKAIVIALENQINEWQRGAKC